MKIHCLVQALYPCQVCCHLKKVSVVTMCVYAYNNYTIHVEDDDSSATATIIVAVVVPLLVVILVIVMVIAVLMVLRRKGHMVKSKHTLESNGCSKPKAPGECMH